MDFINAKELLERCGEYKMTIGQVMVQREMVLSEKTEEEVRQQMNAVLSVMREAIRKGITNREKSLSGLIGGGADQLRKYAQNNQSLLGPNVIQAVSYGMGVMEVNSVMGCIVAAPTAGSCGVLPGALVAAAERFNIEDHNIVDALFTAAAVGYIVTRNATVSGAEGGCQAEIGTATAMASAGLVEMLGGSPGLALSAAAFSFKNIMGLVCDPIAGLVECPCTKRNGLGITNAMLSADMALSGMHTLIPFDEVVEAMYKIGRRMSPDLKETAEGGLAATPTGKRLMKQIFGI